MLDAACTSPDGVEFSARLLPAMAHQDARAHPSTLSRWRAAPLDAHIWMHRKRDPIKSRSGYACAARRREVTRPPPPRRRALAAI